MLARAKRVAAPGDLPGLDAKSLPSLYNRTPVLAARGALFVREHRVARPGGRTGFITTGWTARASSPVLPETDRSPGALTRSLPEKGSCRASDLGGCGETPWLVYRPCATGEVARGTYPAPAGVCFWATRGRLPRQLQPPRNPTGTCPLAPTRPSAFFPVWCGGLLT